MDNRNKAKKPGDGPNGTAESESKYLPELLAEKDSLDQSFTHATKLLSAGLFFYISFYKFCFMCFTLLAI